MREKNPICTLNTTDRKDTPALSTLRKEKRKEKISKHSLYYYNHHHHFQIHIHRKTESEDTKRERDTIWNNTELKVEINDFVAVPIQISPSNIIKSCTKVSLSIICLYVSIQEMIFNFTTDIFCSFFFFLLGWFQSWKSSWTGLPLGGV